MERTDLRSNLLEIALLGKKLKQCLLVADRARTPLLHTDTHTHHMHA